MHVLLTNDDGIHAPGLRALADGLMAAGHRVSVCAPDRERSAASHAVTLNRPLTAPEVDFPGAAQAWAADGTPADCASLGLWLTREDPVDMVIAGINFGMNLGGACVYSGTVGAALEAAMCGAQGLAVSLCVEDRDRPADYSAAARLAARVGEWVLCHPLPEGCIYSLNVPPLPYEKIKGLVPARLGPIFLGTPIYTPVGAEGYRFSFNASRPMDDPEWDVNLIDRGYATLTKLTWDFRMNADDGDLRKIGL